MRRFVGACILSLLAMPVLAATRTWTGTTSGTWSVGSNWGGTAPSAGDDLVFSSANFANALNNDYAANTAFNSLAFSAATTFSPGGNTISLGAGGITQTGSAALNDFIPFTLTAPQTWTSASPGSIGLNGPATLNLGANTLIITGSGSDFLASPINGTGGITIGGTVALQLSGAPLNYTGATTVNSGANLNLTAIGAINTPVVVNSGGTLTITPGFHPVSNSSLTLNSGSTYAVTINGSTINQFSGVTTNGNIVLGGNLSITSSTVLSTGTVLNILVAQSGGLLSGTFAGLPDGSTVSSGAQPYTLHYSSTTASLTALAPGTSAPSLAKSFGAGTIPVGASTSLSFTVTNPNAGSSLSGVGFSDPLPSGLVVATPNGLAGTCGGGTITAAAGSGSVTLSGATLAASANCTFSINVTATSAGTKNNQTTSVTSNEGGSGNQGSATLTVLGPPTISKLFGAASMTAGATTTLTFTLGNPAANPLALNGVGFSDTLPAGMTVATPNGASTTCTGATLTATAGSPTITLSGATINSGATCTAVVNVTSSTPGPANNTTGAVTSTNGGTGGTANASLTVTAPGAIPALSIMMLLLLAAALALIATTKLSS